MRTKQLLIGCMTAGMIWGFTAAAWAGDRFDRRQEKQTVRTAPQHTRSLNAGAPFDRRQDKQTDRIYQGVRNGTITQREFERLNSEQWRIEQRRKKALADGRLTRQEKIRLEQMQDRAGQNIYRAKHNSLQQKKVYSHNSRNQKPAPYCRY